MTGAVVVPFVLAILAASVALGWYVTRGVLVLASRSRANENPAAPAAGGGPGTPPPPPPPPSDEGPTSARAVAALRGGTWIGILERLAITGLILVGYPAGIAIVVAVKGLGRYPELRDNPEASERFVIGTLASMVWSAGLGILGVWLIA